MIKLKAPTLVPTFYTKRFLSQEWEGVARIEQLNTDDISLPNSPSGS